MTTQLFRFVVCTYNIWKLYRWAERESALRRFFLLHCPDILCLQEVQPASLELIDQVLPTHARVHDNFEGWQREGNLYWNQKLFELDDFGIEEIGILEPLRRLFWVRLRPRSTDLPTILVSTAHYTFKRNAQEMATSTSPRVAQAQATVAALTRLASPGNPVIFAGDLNDNAHPIWTLNENGFTDVYRGLGRSPMITIPSGPSLSKEPADQEAANLRPGVPQTIDWIFYRNPLRPLTAEAVDFFVNGYAPSDHKPVLATFGLGDTGA